jgi:hypothetical protein
MRHLVLITGLLLGSPAMAEDPTPPPVMPTEVAEPALPTAFLDQALKVDAKNQVTQGRDQKPLTHRELFMKVERPDLVAKSDAMAQRRTWLTVGAVSLSSASIIAGAILIATAPRLASIACESSVMVYNEICVPRANAHNISGTAVIATGVVASLLMAGFAFNSNPAVLDRDETAALVSGYNSKLARQLRRPPAGIRFLPVVTPDGASLTASLRF